MPSVDNTDPIENAPHAAYDGRAEVRFAAMETRLAAVEVDVAVIRTSFATKDDVQSLRAEIHAATERIMTVLYEHKLEFTIALAKQREDFTAAVTKQRDDFTAALTKQREDLTASMVEQRVELHKTLMSHTWKLYGFASLLMGGVYFIARYVH